MQRGDGSDADSVKTEASTDESEQWSKHFDPGACRFYFYNAATKTSSWAVPAGHTVLPSHTHHHAHHSGPAAGAGVGVGAGATVAAVSGGIHPPSTPRTDSEWIEVWDEEWKRCYWFHPRTGRSAWEHPDAPALRHPKTVDEGVGDDVVAADAAVDQHTNAKVLAQDLSVSWKKHTRRSRRAGSTEGEDDSAAQNGVEGDGADDGSGGDVNEGALVRWREAHDAARKRSFEDLFFTVVLTNDATGGTPRTDLAVRAPRT